MSDDDNQNNAGASPIIRQAPSFECGHSFGRGRGFVPQRNLSPNDESPGFVGVCGNGDDASRTHRDGGRGKGRGRGGRGGGRGRGDSDGGRRGGRFGGNQNGGEGFYNRNGDTGEGDNFRIRKTDGERMSRGRRNDDGTGDDGQSEKPRELYIPPDPTEDEHVMFAAGISSGINFDKYDDIHVKVTGENVPPPIEKFESSGLRQFVLDNVRKSGYTRPTPIQKHAIPIIAQGRDVMACAQTGSGKTAAFLLPIVSVLLSDPRDLIITSERCEPHAIIISPTRELTLQIFNEARKFSHGSVIRTVVTYGGTAAYHQAQQVMKGCHILVATPGRLLDFVNRGRVTFSSVRFFVLDEADRMLDMGFLPDIERMLRHPTMVPTGERQTLMFSATFPEEIQRLAVQFLSNYLFIAVGIVGGACTDVDQQFHMVSKYDKRPKLIELLNQEGGDKTLVFVEMKRTADFIAAYLSEQDFPTTSIHGDRMQREREEALEDFKSGRMGVLVATAVAARGLDIKNVAHVVNYDLPKSIDEYVHRIGRTGRVGNRGKATSFYDSETDAPLARDLVKILNQAGQPVPSWLQSDAQNTGSFSTSSSLPRGRYGGKDIRKFDNQDGDPSDYSHGVPQALEPEEEW